jgi:hypothetical protein
MGKGEQKMSPLINHECSRRAKGELVHFNAYLSPEPPKTGDKVKASLRSVVMTKCDDCGKISFWDPNSLRGKEALAITS